MAWVIAGWDRNTHPRCDAAALGERDIVQGEGRGWRAGVDGRRARTHLVGVDGTEGKVFRGDRALGKGVIKRGLADVGHADDADLRPQAISPSSTALAGCSHGDTLGSAGNACIFCFPCKGGGEMVTLSLLENLPRAHGPLTSSTTSFLGGIFANGARRRLHEHRARRI